jgi:acyl-CoA synthetase (NDP forming)
MSETRHPIKSILYPESLAIIGASPNIYKWGSFLLASLIKGGFKGKIYPVNPNQEMIFGKTCYKSLSEIKDPVDTVFITLPVHLAEKAVDECLRRR